MKRLIFILLAAVVVSTSSVYAQKTYRSLGSDPSVVNDGYLSLVLFGVDAGFGNTSGASLLSVGVDGLYPINDKLKVEAVALYSVFSLAKEGPAFLFNPGAEFSFSSNKKQQGVPVLLSFTTETDWYEGEQTSTWSAVALPGVMQTDYVARGGLYMRNSALEYEEGTTYYDKTGLFHAGVYAGIGMNKKFYVQVEDSDGNRFAGGRFLRTYADLLLLPTKVDLELNGADAGQIEENIGWRVGALIQTVPFGKEDNYGSKISFLGKITWRVEMGQRPLDGFFVTTGIGWVLKRF